MKHKKLILYLSVISFISYLSSCSDYRESGIEGRWQLRQMKTADEEAVEVDTIFYAFKKGVFEYQKLTTPTQYFNIFGNYQISDRTLYIDIDEMSYDPKDRDNIFDWDSSTRNFRIKKHTSTRLQLESADTTYYFRKY